MRSGTALDAVVALCIPLTADRLEWWGNSYEATQYWGGGGGGFQEVVCRPGDVVRQLRVSVGPWGSDLLVVKHIAIECEDLATDYSYEVVPGQTGGTVRSSRWIGCGENEIGSGIYGRSGALIDRIGLMCGPYRF